MEFAASSSAGFDEEDLRMGARILLLTSLSVAAVSPASAAMLVPVPSVPDSTTTTVFAINNNDVIAGSYIGASDGAEHSFFGPLGNYTSFDVGSGGSEARGINDKGLIAGFA